MKIVKLNKTHGLFREGCTHAFRFEHYGEKAGAIERTMTRQFGSQYSRDSQWIARFGHRPTPDSYRIYWIGVKSESMLTMAVLSLDSGKK
jgi:hypothetical protein